MGNQGTRKTTMNRFVIKTAVANSSASTTRNPVSLQTNTEIKILGELVGGYKLLYDDDDDDNDTDRIHPRKSSDTAETASTSHSTTTIEDKHLHVFCIIKYRNQVIHKSSCGEGGLNPIWTVQTGAYFILKTKLSDIIAEEQQNHSEPSVTIAVYCKKIEPLILLETIHMIGMAELKLSDLLVSNAFKNEERYEIKLYNPTPNTGNSTGNRSVGIITVRFRFAIPSDERFLLLLQNQPELLKQKSTKSMSAMNDTDNTNNNTTNGTDSSNNNTSNDNNHSLLVTEANETKVASESFMNVISSAFTSKTRYDTKSGTTKLLVKPYPDPNAVQETTYLSLSEIHQRTMLPSYEWIEAGSGTIGKVYLEILSCTDLPNVDVGSAIGNVTDCFINVVYEDVMVQTNVIDDELSPYWLPWTKRAFLLKMIHPASTLYIAAFDYDLGISQHDPLGRVAVNISNLQPNTDYTLTYTLYPSANVTDRTSAGNITIRVRVEYNNEREALLVAIRPRPTFHVNVRKEKSLSVLRYTCFGEYGDDNEHPFDLTVTRSYVNEIFEYKRNINYCINDAMRSLVFWRPQVRIVKLYVPLHSFLFFCCTTTIVERPYLIPSFTLLGIAWIMIASHTLRMQHPSPWHRCHSLWYYYCILRYGTSPKLIRSIKVNQGAKEAERYNMEWERRLEKDTLLANKQYEMQQEIASIGDEAIHTKVPMGIPIDMIARLTRYQGIVGRMCKKMRLVKSIVTWEEGVVSFWITATFLAAGLVSLLLPWKFLLLWGSRIVVWGLFGPHMMLLDWWLRSEGKDEAALQKAVDNFKKDSWIARIRRQEALKIRDMKCMAFGKYITLIPSHNLSRHFDRPLASSSAKIHNSTKNECKISAQGIPGQHLIGTILPRSEFEMAQCQQELDQLPDLIAEVSTYIQQIKEAENESIIHRILSKVKDINGVDDDNDENDGFEVVPSDDDVLNDTVSPTASADTSDTEKKPNFIQQKTSDSAIGCENRSQSSTHASSMGIDYTLKRTISVQDSCIGPELLTNSVSLAKDTEMARTYSWSAGDTGAAKKDLGRRHPIRSLMETDEDRECGDVEIVLTQALLSVREAPTEEDDEMSSDGEAKHSTLQQRESNVIYIPENDLKEPENKGDGDNDSEDELGSLFESDTEGNEEKPLMQPSINICRSYDVDISSTVSCTLQTAPTF